MNINALYDSGAVRRFHTVADYSGGINQTVADHAWGVALIALALLHRMNRAPSTKMLSALILHDVEEGHIGDHPAPVKWRFPDLAAEMEKAERTVRHELGLEESELTPEEKHVLKWADSLELYAHAQRRARDGARAYESIVRNIHSYMCQHLPQWPEAVIILEELTIES